MVGQNLSDEDLVDQVVRRVLDHPDLLEDHAPLELEVVVGEARRLDDVGEEVECESAACSSSTCP